MFIRCAYLIGKPAQGKDAALHQALQSLLKMYMSFEKIRAVKLLTGREWEDGAPGIYATLELCFDSEADLKAALATPFRQEFRAYFAANVIPLFDGIVKHINYDVLEQTP
jgi:hypothetical protein